MKTITKILKWHILYHALSFLDNIIIKSLYIMYNGEDSLLSVRKYILKYIMWLDGVLVDLK